MKATGSGIRDFKQKGKPVKASLSYSAHAAKASDIEWSGGAVRVQKIASDAYYAAHPGTHAARCLAAARALIAEAHEHAGDDKRKGRK